MHILGISAFYHDSAAALLRDGAIVAAAQEERFTRKKHDESFPRHAVEYCLREAGIGEAELDYVVYYEKPLLKFERLLETYLGYAPAGFRSFCRAIPLWLKHKLFLPRTMDSALRGAYRRPYVFVGHHEAHAASAFFPSPFPEAAILTVDGVGEWSTSTIGRGQDHRIEMLEEQRFPHSLGLLYSAFTYYCGFRVNSGEYKLMGLAPYGSPRYRDVILERILDLKADGSFRLQMEFFQYCQGLRMTNERFHALFGRAPRPPDSAMEQLDMDVAASVQAAAEEILLRMARHAHARTGSRQLCLAGGVALNCVANGRILREGPYEKIWIQPAAGDAGGALGAALFVWHQLLNRPKNPSSLDLQGGSFLGPSFSNAEIEDWLNDAGAVWTRIPGEQELCALTAGYLEAGLVVGWFQDRMEFGPRALGHRSILGDPRSPAMQQVMNLKIKYRESFRPFAPAVLAERAAEYFDWREGEESPYMLLVAEVRAEQRRGDPDDLSGVQGLEKLGIERSTIPAVTHVDYSARIQTVDQDRNPRFHRLLREFEARTGCPVLINTSFNVRGEPIVCTPAEAYRCFLGTGMDVLVLENCVLRKEEQPGAEAFDRDAYAGRFAMD
ncbi:MAG TPA: carbamoyltransferase [Verrucomicrobiales bacterium]|nr:carbamoyltransferase [Verrucomicrobiales bacterium]